MPWGKAMNEMSGVAFFPILSTRRPSPRSRAQSCSARSPRFPLAHSPCLRPLHPTHPRLSPRSFRHHSHLSRGRTEASLQAPACQSVALQIPQQHVVHRCLNVETEMVWQHKSKFPREVDAPQPPACPDPAHISELFREWFQK